MSPQPSDAERGSASGELVGDRYRLRRKIGSGGAATVWLADDERLERQVAIKRLHTSGPEDAARRLTREARIGAALSHPNLVTVYDAVPDHEGVLVVMEYVDGSDLGRLLEDGRASDWRALAITAAVGAALEHLHRNGVVHRDVKPSNVLIDRDGEVKLTDLGIARALADTDITRSGVMLGSLPYMSPEQLNEDEVGAASDVYQLALLAYELLSGEPARAGGDAPQISYAALNQPAADLGEIRPDLPEQAAAVLRRALDRDPRERPASAAELVGELERALGAGREPVPPGPIPSAGERAEPATPAQAPAPARLASPAPRPVSGRSRRPLLGAAAALTALVVLALVAVALIDGDASEQAPGGGGEAPAQEDAGSGSNAAAAEPTAAVEGFYGSAAAGDIEAALSYTSRGLERQLEGPDAFAAQVSTLKSIEFETLETSSQSADRATVEFETVATHTDRTESCSGSAAMVRSGDSWLLDSLQNVSCDP